MTSLLYITISLLLTGLVGRALSRSGRAFLDEAFAGQGGVAEAASRLLVVAFYLLSLGFIALTVPSWSHVTSTAQALQLLSGRLGVLLLVLGALHVTTSVAFARLRRTRSRPPLPYFADPGAASPDRPEAPQRAAAGRPEAAPRQAGPAPALWPPRPPRVVH
ncbi:MAG TPA: hypothetical protein VFV41_19145 [Streptosporangiaceae bacterium]|nr:hypothetical protein [Streptosporangiaceae bacterium]